MTLKMGAALENALQLGNHKILILCAMQITVFSDRIIAE